MQFISLAVLFKRIRAIRFMMSDRSVPIWKKGLIVFGIAYLLLPVDLIPPFVPVFGFLDDFILWLFLLDFLKDELDKYWKDGSFEHSSAVRGAQKKYRGKNIVDGVEYEVHEEEEHSDT